MQPLKLFLFGSPRLEKNQTLLPLGRRKALAILAYLAVTGQPSRRDTLLTLLWPNYDPSTGRSNLRRDLSYLKKAMGEVHLHADRTQATLNLGHGLWVDVSHFRELLAAVRRHQHDQDFGQDAICDDCAAKLAEAVTTYTADLMTGFTLPDAPDFNEWLYFEAEGLRQSLSTALQKLIAYHTSPAEYQPAIVYARRWLALDPLHESAHRQLMRLYAWSGQQASALRQYQECHRLLSDELDVAPDEETTALFEAIKARQIAPPDIKGMSGEGSPEERSPGPADAIATRPPPPHNLPPQPTPFLGREQELSALGDLLADPETRLITIVGPGGMGKTRLALAAAERLLHPRDGSGFVHGIYFVPLTPLSDVAHIEPALAEALDFPLEGGRQQTRTPRQQILDYLRQKKMLLVLDNFEHLLDGVEIVADILGAAPAVQILSTSRERLHLHGEQVYPIHGLEFPDWETPADAQRYTAVQLFLQSAWRVQPDFTMESEDLTYLTRICSLVGGMPLGLELAAGWVDVLSPLDIATEIQRSLDFLETDVRNVPRRHRSMRAVFDASWHQMRPIEREAFMQLSVFRGGFTRQAAQTVAGASVKLLGTLASKSMLQYNRTRDRYEIHELLRQYAAEKLMQDGQAESAARDRHAAYYCQALHERENDLKGARQQEALAEIELEIENIRTAWRWAVDRHQVDYLSKATDSLGCFHEWRGRYLEGRDLFQAAAALLERPDSGQTMRLLAKALAWQSVFERIIGDFAGANQQWQRSMDLLDQLEAAGQDIRFERAFALLHGGYLRASEVASLTAFALLKESLALYRALDDRWGMADSLEGLGLSQLDGSAAWHEIDQALQEGLALRQKMGDRRGITLILERLSNSARYQGHFSSAERFSQECLDLCRQIGGRANVAFGQESLGMTLIHMGRFAQAESRLRDAAAIRTDLGDRFALRTTLNRLSAALYALGDVENGRDMAQQALDLSHEIGEQSGIAYSLCTRGQAPLLTGDFEEAEQYFRASIAEYGQNGGGAIRGIPLACLVSALRGLGQAESAQKYAHEALHIAADRQHFIVLGGWALPAVLILMADQGNTERPLAWYAMLESRYPYLKKSHRARVLFRRPLDALAASLPADVAQAATVRGRDLDPWDTAAQLLEELPKLGWHPGT
jgi:predicted ATPase/DNA-binding SARP family transcriptional activator